MQVSKWGNSVAIRLPAALVKALELEEGDEIEISIASDRSQEVKRKPSLEELFNLLRRHKSKAPEGFKFDREEAHER